MLHIACKISTYKPKKTQNPYILKIITYKNEKKLLEVQYKQFKPRYQQDTERTITWPTLTNSKNIKTHHHQHNTIVQ